MIYDISSYENNKIALSIKLIPYLWKLLKITSDIKLFPPINDAITRLS